MRGDDVSFKKRLSFYNVFINFWSILTLTYCIHLKIGDLIFFFVCVGNLLCKPRGVV